MKGKGATADISLSPDVGLLKVSLRFFVIFAILQTALWFLWYRGSLDPWLEWNARITGACSNIIGVPATVAGNEVFLATRILRIDFDCTGIPLMLVYAALVLAYPLRTKRKLIGMAVGLPVLALANMLRLITVAELSGPLDDGVFLFVHDYLFKVCMTAVVIALWAVYLVSARRHASQG